MGKSFIGIAAIAAMIVAGCTEETVEKEAVEVKEKILAKEDSDELALDITIPEVDGMDDFNEHADTLGKNLEADVWASVMPKEEGSSGVSPMRAEGAMDFTVEFVDDQTVSVLIESYLYEEGGAHGVTSLEPLNYDLRTESVIELTDLFEGENGLAELFEAAKMEIENSDLNEFLDKPFMEIKEDQQFYLTADSVVLVYDQYEIAAGAAGPQEIMIAKDELKSLKDFYK